MVAKDLVYQLKRDFKTTDYRGREISFLNWVEVGILNLRKDGIQKFLEDNGLPFGYYCTVRGKKAQYYHYFDIIEVQDALFPVYTFREEPLLAACRIHWAEKEFVGKNRRERFTGAVFGEMELFENNASGEYDFVGDMTPDELMEIMYDQFQKEAKKKKKKTSP